MPRGSTKKYPCPVCGELKSKKALTCMPCYRRGKGKSKEKGHDLRLDKEAICRLKERVAEIETEIERERKVEYFIKTKELNPEDES